MNVVIVLWWLQEDLQLALWEAVHPSWRNLALFVCVSESDIAGISSVFGLWWRGGEWVRLGCRDR